MAKFCTLKTILAYFDVFSPRKFDRHFPPPCLREYFHKLALFILVFPFLYKSPAAEN